jgi:hypothetical protein
MAIHIRVVTPITTQGFRSPEDATKLESDGVKVAIQHYRRPRGWQKPEPGSGRDLPFAAKIWLSRN